MTNDKLRPHTLPLREGQTEGLGRVSNKQHHHKQNFTHTLPLREGQTEGLGRVSNKQHHHKQNFTRLALSNAQNLRQNTTSAENKLWYYLKNRQMNNFKFTRQKPLGNYVGDFVCRQIKLVIELDGEQHAYDKNVIHDNKRTEYLEKQGYKVLRFWNNDVYKNITNVLEMIYNCLNDLSLVDGYNMRPTPNQQADLTLPKREGVRTKKE